MAKQTRTITLTRNYLYKWILQTWVINRAIPDPIDKERVTVTILCGGGSRAGKTYSIANVIYTIMRSFADTKMKAARPLHIIVYRDTLVSARDTYKDFIECYQGMGLLEGQDEQIKRGEADYKTTNSANVKIEMYGHTIEFKGLPDDGKEPTGCDIAFINELIEHKNQSMFDRISRKVRLLVMADWNPKDSQHFAYDMSGHNIFYSTTVYWDNKHLPDGLKAKAEKESPWDFKDCELYLEAHDDKGGKILKRLPEGFNFQDWKAGNYPFDGFIRRRWLKPERPDNCKEEDFHLYRAVNEQNRLNGTINRSLWLTYGEGIPSGQEGAIFHDATWVKDFPESGHDDVVLSFDLGFTQDNTVLVRSGVCGLEAYIEVLACQPTKTPEITFSLFEPQLIKECQRRINESGDTNKIAKDIELWICGESQDRYGTETWVSSLNEIAFSKGYNWNFFKIQKKSILAGVEIMKKFKLNLVEMPATNGKLSRFQLEQQNYVFRTVNGQTTNEPDPNSRFCDIWDAARYGFQNNFAYVN